MQKEDSIKESINMDVVEIKMSSRYVAEVTGKSHKNILTDIRKIIKDFNGLENQPVKENERKTASIEKEEDFNVHKSGGIKKDQKEIGLHKYGDSSYVFELSEYKDKKGEMRTEYLLTKKQLLLLISGYDVILRARIIDRLEELEKQEFKRRCLDYDNQRHVLEKQLLEQQNLILEQQKTSNEIHKASLYHLKKSCNNELSELRQEVNKYEDFLKDLSVSINKISNDIKEVSIIKASKYFNNMLINSNMELEDVFNFNNKTK